MRIFLFAIFICLASCSSDKKPEVVPVGLLSPQKMSEVLAEVHIANAALVIKPPSSDSLNVTKEVYYSHIYEHNKVTKEIFDSSFAYYCRHPLMLDSIYEEVVISLSKTQAKLDSTKR